MAGAGAARWAWPFGFEPYDIQKAFMGELYEVLERGDVGIFESPTGSGKSLSMIASALHWLETNRDRVLDQDGADGPVETGEPAWVRAFSKARREQARSDAERKQKMRRERVERRRGEQAPRGAARRKRALGPGKPGGAKRRAHDPEADAASDSEFALGDAPSADDSGSDWRKRAYDSDEESLGGRLRFGDEGADNDEEVAEPRKIFFCSRTHSQLSQFMNEIKRTPFSSSIACVALGSRKQLCTNDAVRALGSVSRINDKCLDLIDQARGKGAQTPCAQAARKAATGSAPADARASTPARSACPYMDKNAMSRLGDDILYEAQDIESVADLAKEEGACGYYASRAAVRDAEFVALPYSMLLHRKTRESLGIRLKGNIVICDEAHNVIEAINEVHSVSLTLAELTQARADLVAYRDRYRARLNPANKVSVNSLLTVVGGLQSYLQRKAAQGGSSVVTCGALALEADIDHVNIFPLLRFLEASRLAQKLRGFAERYVEQRTKAGEVMLAGAPGQGSAQTQSAKTKRVQAARQGRQDPRQQNPAARRRPASLRPVQAFLEGLSNTEKDGKVLLVADGPRTSIKFLMLNPGTHFREIVDEAHAVVLAGGTMKPTVDVETQLFGHLAPQKIHLFSCGHVIPKENMLCLCLGSGPTRTPLELTFANRTQPAVMDEIVRSLINMCSIVPHGLVVFLPSYSYADQLFARWRAQNQWARLEAKKTVVCDSRDAVQADKLLQSYAAAARTRRGALLFSVVGGKLSEGINFKDELARCVVMVGLPFPNAGDPELKAKMDFLDRRALAAKSAKPLDPAASAHATTPSLSSKEFYENLCMKAVNQCIGRAIRHRNDFAAVVLMDSRYARPGIVAKLPQWIVGDEGLAVTPNFGGFVKRLRGFLGPKIAA